MSVTHSTRLGQKNCLVCGKAYVVKRADNKGFCSRRCNLHVASQTRNDSSRRDRQCEQCGGTFAGLTCDRFCGEECKVKSLARECSVCGKGFRSPHPNAHLCSTACRIKFFAGKYESRYECQPGIFECVECGQTVKAESHFNEQRRFCSKKCGRAEAKRARRARKKAQYVEPVGLGCLVKRDKGVCQICKTKVDLSASAPDPLSPTVDHIIPLAKRGEHSYANCQLAHFGCNTAKGDRIDSLF